MENQGFITFLVADYVSYRFMTVRENLRFEKAMGLNYVGGCPQNRDRDNQLIGGTETW